MGFAAAAPLFHTSRLVNLRILRPESIAVSETSKRPAGDCPRGPPSVWKTDAEALPGVHFVSLGRAYCVRRGCRSSAPPYGRRAPARPGGAQSPRAEGPRRPGPEGAGFSRASGHRGLAPRVRSTGPFPRPLRSRPGARSRVLGRRSPGAPGVHTRRGEVSPGRPSSGRFLAPAPRGESPRAPVPPRPAETGLLRYPQPPETTLLLIRAVANPS